MISDPSSPSSSPFPQVQPAPAKKSYRWVIFVLIGILGLTVLCVAVVAALVLKNISAMPADVRSFESPVDRFMRAGVKQDAKAAFTLFSSRGQQQMPLTKIKQMFSTNYYGLFAGYQGLTSSTYNLHSGPGTDQDADLNLPDGTFVILRGTLNYDDEVSGTFEAALEQVGQDWMLYSIEIDVPPSKFRSNQNG